ncbi:hypothetical protein RCL1_000134 [Eukaryota sp. TZLM3-RCL]
MQQDGLDFKKIPTISLRGKGSSPSLSLDETRQLRSQRLEQHAIMVISRALLRTLLRRRVVSHLITIHGSNPALVLLFSPYSFSRKDYISFINNLVSKFPPSICQSFPPFFRSKLIVFLINSLNDHLFTEQKLFFIDFLLKSLQVNNYSPLIFLISNKFGPLLTSKLVISLSHHSSFFSQSLLLDFLSLLLPLTCSSINFSTVVFHHVFPLFIDQSFVPINSQSIIMIVEKSELIFSESRLSKSLIFLIKFLKFSLENLELTHTVTTIFSKKFTEIFNHNFDLFNDSILTDDEIKVLVDFSNSVNTFLQTSNQKLIVKRVFDLFLVVVSPFLCMSNFPFSLISPSCLMFFFFSTSMSTNISTYSFAALSAQFRHLQSIDQSILSKIVFCPKIQILNLFPLCLILLKHFILPLNWTIHLPHRYTFSTQKLKKIYSILLKNVIPRLRSSEDRSNNDWQSLEGILTLIVPFHLRSKVFIEYFTQKFGRYFSQQRGSTIYVSRSDVLFCYFSSCFSRFSADPFSSLITPFVIFVNENDRREEGVDAGGLFKEFVTLFLEQIFDENFGLFTLDSSGFFIPNLTNIPKLSQKFPGFDPAQVFYFVGLVVASFFARGYVLGFGPSAFFANQIQGNPLTFKDLQSMDNQIYQSFSRLITSSDEELSSFDLYFSFYDQSCSRDVELIPNGKHIKVNSNNLPQYLDLVTRYMFTKFSPYISQFCAGISSLIPSNIFSLFSISELQLLFSGTVEFSLNDFISSIVFSASDEMKLVIIEAIKQLNLTELRLLLRFITGLKRAPLLSFHQLSPPLSIRVDTTAPLSLLPYASTCTNTMAVPQYNSVEMTLARLRVAITEGQTFEMT